MMLDDIPRHLVTLFLIILVLGGFQSTALRKREVQL